MRLEMRYLATALALICLGCTESPSIQENALIAEVEQRVHLPKGAGDLRCYKRYYTVVRGERLKKIFNGYDTLPFREMLVGTYRVPGAGETPGIKWVGSEEEAPKLYDGGCGDMTVWYAPEWRGEDIKAFCSLDFAGEIPDQIRGKPLTC